MFSRVIECVIDHLLTLCEDTEQESDFRRGAVAMAAELLTPPGATVDETHDWLEKHLAEPWQNWEKRRDRIKNKFLADRLGVRQ